jgi:hypothetical protein
MFGYNDSRPSAKGLEATLIVTAALFVAVVFASYYYVR